MTTVPSRRRQYLIRLSISSSLILSSALRTASLLLSPDFQPELYAYLGGLTRELRGRAYGSMAPPTTFTC